MTLQESERLLDDEAAGSDGLRYTAGRREKGGAA
jgi:hypothetical protein